MMKQPYEQNKTQLIEFLKGNFSQEKLDELMNNINDGSGKFMNRADFETWLAHSLFDSIHDFFADNGVDVN
jgi:hypothetical protein